MAQDLINYIRKEYHDCITTSFRENNCSLQLDIGLSDALVMIHGSKYQAKRKFSDRLCDRILFLMNPDLAVCAAELKGGSNAEIAKAIEQIHNGLKVAEAILGNYEVVEWRPVLLTNGHVGGSGKWLLQRRPVQFRKESKTVQVKRCRSPLSSILR